MDAQTQYQLEAGAVQPAPLLYWLQNTDSGARGPNLRWEQMRARLDRTPFLPAHTVLLVLFNSFPAARLVDGGVLVMGGEVRHACMTCGAILSREESAVGFCCCERCAWRAEERANGWENADGTPTAAALALETIPAECPSDADPGL